MKDFEVTIVGGGIGGLCTAIGLHRAGVPVRLFEAAPQFAEIGAGISMGPNSQNALKGLNLYHEFQRHAFIPDRNLFFQWRTGVGEDQRFLAETVSKHYGAASIHRAELLETLVAHLPKELVSFGKRLDRIEQSERSETADNATVTLHFKDGSSHRTDLVIGCDGIHSQVRGALDPAKSGPSAKAGSDALQWSGSWAYRGLIPRERFQEAVGGEKGRFYARESQMFLGKDRHILIFPIQNGEVVNLVAFRTDRSQWPKRPAMKAGDPWVQEASKESLLGEFEGWGTDLINMLKCIDKPSRWALHQMVPPLDSYVNRRVIVAGDAAHGGTPHQGAMAGQAIEDALFFSRLFGHPNVTASNLLTAIRATDAIRMPRANEVLVKSLEVGDVIEFAGPLGDDLDAVAKDLVTRFDYLWDYDLDDEHRRLNLWLTEQGI